MADVTTLEGNASVLALFGGKRSFAARQAARAGRVTRRAVKTTVRVTKKIGRGTGHAIMQAGRVTRRVAKRLVRGVANKMLLNGDPLLGASAPTMTKNAAKTLILPTATAAVTASTVTAPLAPIVPILVNEVIDEVYSAISKRVKKGMSPERAASEVAVALEKDDDKALGASPSMPVILGVGAGIIALIMVLKKRR